MATIDVRPAPVEENGQTIPLLAVRIDGQLVSDQFPPFDASFASIRTSTCTECYLATRGEITFCGSLPDGMDSHDVLGIRRVNDRIIWFHQHDAWSCPILPEANKHDIWYFDIENYESQLGGNSSDLPELAATDIQRVIQFSQIPEPNNAIFRTPLSEHDRSGCNLMALIQQIANDDSLRIVSDAEDVTPYEIGFERNCGPDVMFDAGLVDGAYALKLNRNPAFPLWITSDIISKRFPEVAT